MCETALVIAVAQYMLVSLSFQGQYSCESLNEKPSPDLQNPELLGVDISRGHGMGCGGKDELSGVTREKGFVGRNAYMHYARGLGNQRNGTSVRTIFISHGSQRHTDGRLSTLPPPCFLILRFSRDALGCWSVTQRMLPSGSACNHTLCLHSIRERVILYD